jgi:hypothetical protein
LQHGGAGAAADKGITCIHINNALNRMAENCFKP